ncbi:MAG: Ig-like domain-containing protein [Mobilitalea sp.]
MIINSLFKYCSLGTIFENIEKGMVIMSNNFIKIESVKGSNQNKVKQSLKFKTGNFVWRIKFTAPLNPATVNNRNLYVTSLSQVPLQTNIRYDTVDNCIEIEPLSPYEKNESYLLHITTNVKSKLGQSLSDEITIQFKV